MGVKVGEYCVLELTMIYNTSIQITKSPGICQKESGVGTRGCEQRMFHPWDYKHSTICDQKGLVWKAVEVCCPLFGLCLASPESYLCRVWDLSQARARSVGLLAGRMGLLVATTVRPATALSWVSGSTCCRGKCARDLPATCNKAWWENLPWVCPTFALGLSHICHCPISWQAHLPAND